MNLEPPVPLHISEKENEEVSIANKQLDNVPSLIAR